MSKRIETLEIVNCDLRGIAVDLAGIANRAEQDFEVAETPESMADLSSALLRNLKALEDEIGVSLDALEALRAEEDR
jgi:hypothetical protein